MKIFYTQKHLNRKLIFAVIWLILTLVRVYLKSEPFWLNYSFFSISILYLFSYFYSKKNQYLTIENEVLTVNNLLKRQIDLSEVKKVKKHADSYILTTDNTKLIINMDIIASESQENLKAILDNLELEES
ncbi:hypothetical protein KRX57_09795 [Weeksellaceae bacterium TAE3-ERU29]|nr:hypothetical protein [Weeksellaceae bacterium TAE3-ERU29]